MMKFLLQVILLSIMTMVSAYATTNKQEKKTLSTVSPQQAIDSLLQSFGEDINIGILVQDAKTGQVLYSKNPDRLFLPASNQKIVTGFAALKYLGPNFLYHTNLFVDKSKILAGVLNDSVYLQFVGDPTFTAEQLDKLMATLVQSGVRQVNGSLIIDDSAFDQNGMSAGSAWDDEDFCWAAPINAIIVDKNCARAMFSPGLQVGQPANMMLPTYPQSVQFINHVVTQAANEACKLQFRRQDHNTFVIDGCVRFGAPVTEVRVAIANPRANLKTLLTYLLQKNGIMVTQGIQFHKIENYPTLLSSVSSSSLPILVKRMLKDSDNLIANSLFKTMGIAFTHQEGDFKNGSDSVRDFLQKSVQLDISKYTLVDGSGLSHYNYLTPRQLTTLLIKNWQFPASNLLFDSLPIAGTDGTLQNRMMDPLTKGKIFAKTGTETGISTLSGYVLTNSHRTLVFSIMINGFVEHPARYEGLEDKICTAMLDIV